jgi:hypothetical protein
MRFDTLFPNLSRRSNAVERMEEAHCDERQLLATVDAFQWSNRLFTRYRPALERWIIADMLKEPARSYTLIDLGAGGCDIAVWLLRRCGQRGLHLSIRALELNPAIAAHARRKHGNMPGLEILHQDALQWDRLGPADYVFGNHFLHHLKDSEIVRLLGQLVKGPIRRFLFSDLLRSYPAYYAHSVVAPVLFPRTFVGYDGRLSIRKGFTVAEMNRLICEAGLQSRTVLETRVPARLLVVGYGTKSGGAHGMPALPGVTGSGAGNSGRGGWSRRDR